MEAGQKKGIVTRRKSKCLRSISGVAAVATLWWMLPAPNSVLLPPLWKILSTLGDLAASGILCRDILHSSLRVISGVLIAVSLALAFGLVAMAERRIVDFFMGLVELLRPIPPIAWTPVAILVFGIGWEPAIAIVAISSFFPMWLSLLSGIDNVRSEHIVAARCLGASRLILLTDVLVPSVLPSIAQGLRFAVGIGWFSVIAAEMVGASTGLGHAVQNSSLNLEMARTYGYLLVIGVIGFLSSAFLTWVTARIGEGIGG